MHPVLLYTNHRDRYDTPAAQPPVRHKRAPSEAGPAAAALSVTFALVTRLTSGPSMNSISNKLRRELKLKFYVASDLQLLWRLLWAPTGE
jgi:hypothetical protein